MLPPFSRVQPCGMLHVHVSQSPGLQTICLFRYQLLLCCSILQPDGSCSYNFQGLRQTLSSPTCIIPYVLTPLPSVLVTPCASPLALPMYLIQSLFSDQLRQTSISIHLHPLDRHAHSHHIYESLCISHFPEHDMA